MRFAILGDHPEGWALAAALASSNRHQVGDYCGLKPQSEIRANWPSIRVTSDLEDVLADPEVEGIIVASGPGKRLDQLRRVLQSERPAFCVHPVDRKPDGAYEINMLQGDTHQVVVPIMPLIVNQALDNLADRIRKNGPARLVELECRGPGELLFEDEHETHPHFPGWELLRGVGGPVAEVQAFARDESVSRGEPVTIQGRFENGGLFRAVYLPNQRETMMRLTAIDAAGESVVESITVGAVEWQRLLERFEAALVRLRHTPRAAPGSGPAADPGKGPNWLDEIRAAELDDAARRSIERRRAVPLEYQEVSEDVGFKGTMTLIGCGLLWFIPVLLIASVWLPHIGWLIVPILFGFLLLQLLRWFVPAAPPPGN